jgi:hypothetical protein
MLDCGLKKLPSIAANIGRIHNTRRTTHSGSNREGEKGPGV